MLDELNGWIGNLFARENIGSTVKALVASQGGERKASARQAVEKRAAEAEARLRRLQAAIEAGADPAALVDALNSAQEQRAAARAELEGRPAPNALGEAEAHAMVDSFKSS